MDREVPAWTRIVVCVSKSTVNVLGQRISTRGEIAEASRALVINRVNLADITERDTSSSPPATSVVTGSALVGFLELRDATYLGLVTKTSVAGNITANHTVYTVGEVEWIPVNFGVNAPSKTDARHLSLIANLFKSADFFFSDTVNLVPSSRSRFCWNAAHTQRLTPFSPAWTVNVMHGSFRSIHFNSLNRQFDFVLLARRSRRYAGTRYRKRGVNRNGDAANEVETEQILIAYGPPDVVMSFTQLRGSVPLHWSQDSHGLLPKPEIVVAANDLQLESTRLHFANLVARYGSPILPVSLLLRKEGSGEAVLGAEYAHAVSFLTGRDIAPLVQFDLKGACIESSDPDSMGTVLPSGMYAEARRLAHTLLKTTGWTVQKHGKFEQRQSGIIRSNCVDCLDRTSIFQFVLGLEVLNKQLVSLGVLEADPGCHMKPSWASGAPSSSLTALVEEMFEFSSDQLAVQYAGTATHKKYSSQQTRSQSIDGGLINTGRELFISISRHYSSAFSDNDKQNAMNLFLGLYRGVTDEDCCAIEGIDKFVHSVTSYDSDEEDGIRGDVEPFQTTGRDRGQYSTFKEIQRQRPSNRSILFNPVINLTTSSLQGSPRSTPPLSQLPRRSPSLA